MLLEFLRVLARKEPEQLKENMFGLLSPLFGQLNVDLNVRFFLHMGFLFPWRGLGHPVFAAAFRKVASSAFQHRSLGTLEL